MRVPIKVIKRGPALRRLDVEIGEGGRALSMAVCVRPEEEDLAASAILRAARSIAVAPSCSDAATVIRSTLSRMGWESVTIDEICENAYCILRKRET